jgi:hypothetical protein
VRCPANSPTSPDQVQYVVQGWKVFANELLMQLDVPEGQTAIEVPTELFEHLTKDGQVSGEIRKFSDPIMLVTEQGTCILQGPEMHDPEAPESDAHARL